MPTEGRAGTVASIGLAAALLLWPAFWNGYPLVFSDTGTYLSQAIEQYVGWDRPVFYSLFLLPLHLTLTTWPAIVVQALLVAHVLHLVRRTLLPDASVWWLLPLAGAMTLASSLPWFVSQLMPDVFTGVLVLVLGLLIFAPERLSRRERIWLMAFAAFMIAAHQSHVLLALALLAVLLPLRGTVALHSVAPLVLAVVALVSVNLLAFGRASLSPFGNVFLLARVIYDGPGADVLRRATVTPWIERDFPHSEAGAYAASRQSAGMLEVPAWMQALHLATALAGVAACVALLLPASRKRISGHPAAGFAAAALLALLANAAITGGLSGPHDRYQSRIMWLPPLIAVLGIASLRTVADPAFSR